MSSIAYRSGFERDGIEHAYLHQVHNGIPVANTASNVVFKDGKVVSFASSFANTGMEHADIVQRQF
jgi:hypothetical protein